MKGHFLFHFHFFTSSSFLNRLLIIHTLLNVASTTTRYYFQCESSSHAHGFRKARRTVRASADGHTHFRQRDGDADDCNSVAAPRKLVARSLSLVSRLLWCERVPELVFNHLRFYHISESFLKR